MRVQPRSCLLITLLSLSTAMGAQQGAPAPPQRDPQAIAVVQNALAAMGGSAVGQLLNAQVQGTLAPAANSANSAGHFTWTDDFSGTQLEFRHELDAADATRVLASGHGSPAYQKGASLKPLRSHTTYTALPYHLPVILLSRALANPDYSIQYAGQVVVEGRPALQVVFKIQTGPVEKALSEQRWDFDTTSGLPTRIDYRIPSTIYATQSIPAAVELSNYQVVNGVAVPYQITAFEDGAAVTVATVSSVAFNVSVAPSLFDLGAGAGP